MTELDQQQLGKTLWNIADTLRAMTNADDFRDYMLSFHLLRNHRAHNRDLTQQIFPSLE